MREIKNLPDNETLNQLIEMAEDFEKEAKKLYDMATEIDEKWRIRLIERRKDAIEQSKTPKK